MGRGTSKVVVVALMMYISLCQCLADEGPTADDLDVRCDRLLRVAEQEGIVGAIPAVCQVSEWGDPIPDDEVNPLERAASMSGERFVSAVIILARVFQRLARNDATHASIGWQVYPDRRAKPEP